MNDDHNDDARPRPAPGEAAFLGRAVELAVDNAAAGQLPFGALSSGTARCRHRRQHEPP